MRIRALWAKLREKIEFLISLLLFSCVYILGIGTTALFARLVGHRFLIHVFKGSSWQSPTGSNKIERMY